MPSTNPALFPGISHRSIYATYSEDGYRNGAQLKLQDLLQCGENLSEALLAVQARWLEYFDKNIVFPKQKTPEEGKKELLSILYNPTTPPIKCKENAQRGRKMQEVNAGHSGSHWPLSPEAWVLEKPIAYIVLP